jgi:fructose-bisphosphate aldolase class I
MVPIVETEVLIDGDHSIERCYHVTEAVLRELFAKVAAQRVQLEGLLLKVNMVLSGKDAPNRAGPDEVAAQTLACLRRTVPAAVPGIVFLSGGQSDDEANRNLAAIARLGAATGAPWQLSFSFARALQGAPMKAWAGNPDNVERAQDALKQRAFATATARQGLNEPPIESASPLAASGARR